MKELTDFINDSRELIIRLQTILTENPAVGPENGGDGEFKKAMALKSEISQWGFDSIEEIMAPDNRVSSGKRPSLIATIEGKNTSKNLWIISHLDVVPPGDIGLWDTDPFKVVVKDDLIYGRGTEDNQQGLVSSLIAAKAMLEKKVKPDINIKLLFVADEEMGSEYGIMYLLENTQLFKKDDLILTPDVGDPNGDFIEVAEKSILWLEFTITGKQSHGSRPDLGINAARASSKLDISLSTLYDIFNAQDAKFDTKTSTFEPTKRIGSLTNYNTIPGSEILCYDCRILPCYQLDDILSKVDHIVKGIEKETGTTISLKIGQKVQSPAPTPDEAPIVQLLMNSIERVLHKKAKTYGIGGGTVAAYFRMRGIHATLWSTLNETLHGPNENSSIKNCITDALVFTDMMVHAK